MHGQRASATRVDERGEASDPTTPPAAGAPLLKRGGETRAVIIFLPKRGGETRAVIIFLPSLREGNVMPRRLKWARDKTRSRVLQSRETPRVRGAVRAARNGGRSSGEPRGVRCRRTARHLRRERARQGAPREPPYLASRAGRRFGYLRGGAGRRARRALGAVCRRTVAGLKARA